MKKPNWDRIQEIYHAAASVPRSELETFVARACDHDPFLIREVHELLAASDSSDDFLRNPIVKLGVDDLVGTTIDSRYVIKSELGDGGMSHVYLADDTKLEQQAVIKVLSRKLLEDSYALKKFRQEVEALLRTRHDNVVRVFDKGELVDGRPYIVMEYVDGVTLSSQINPEGMPLELVAAILKQIGAALEHVHQKDIFHRDLKPANIMLTRDSDSVVLVDFGIAKVKHSAIASTTVNGTAFGTLAYVSPEQLRGEEVTAASDIYSMAVIAYQMVTGRLPFDPASPADQLDKQRAGIQVKPVVLRRNLPPKAQDIILRGLKFKPEARYANAREFGDNLAQALLNSPIASKDRRWIYLLIIVVGVALLSYGIYRYVTRPPKPEIRPLVTTKEPKQSFTYYLTVKRAGDGKEYQSHGENETFHNGDKFRLSVVSPVPAFVYVINERPPEAGETSLRMIFPNNATNDGLAMVGPDQAVQSDWFTFRGTEGDENFWLVWSLTPVAELEEAKAEAFKHPKGGMTGQNLVTVREFLRKKQLEEKVTVSNYKESKKAVARGANDILVALAQFKHQ